MSVAVLPFFVMQRSIFTKERCNKAYAVPEYCLSKFIVSLPGVFVIALVPSLLIVFPALLNGFGVYLATLFLALLVAEAFMALIASLVPHYIVGIALAAGLFGFFMLCCGFFIVKDDIPPYLIWGFYLAPHTYIFRLFMYNEFEPINNFNSAQFEDGDAVLEYYSMENTNVGANMGILVLYIAVFQLLFAGVLQKWHTGLR